MKKLVSDRGQKFFEIFQNFLSKKKKFSHIKIVNANSAQER